MLIHAKMTLFTSPPMPPAAQFNAAGSSHFSIFSESHSIYRRNFISTYLLVRRRAMLHKGIYRRRFRLLFTKIISRLYCAARAMRPSGKQYGIDVNDGLISWRSSAGDSLRKCNSKASQRTPLLAAFATRLPRHYAPHFLSSPFYFSS